MGDVTAELIEIYSDEDLRKATGWVSILPGGSSRGEGDALEAERLRRTLNDVDPDVWRDIYRGMLRIHRLDLHLTAAAAAPGPLAGAPEGDVQEASRDHDLGGLEAAAVAPLAALASGDWVIPGHRESAAALYRGLPVRDYLANVLGNAHDRAKGRQPPRHPVTPRALRVLPASSSGSTQLPQAAGIAWAAKIKRDDTVVLCFLDAEATAAEDFHTGLNFAAVFKVPVVFLCVNTRHPLDGGHLGPAGAPVEPGGGVGLGSETVALKALAYGLPGIRVDGSDALAVFQVVRGAVQAARAGGGPTLIEAVVTRRRTRPNPANGEALGEASDPHHPMQRLARWLRDSNLLEAGAEALWTAEIDAEIRDARAFETGVPGLSVDTLIEDVYQTPPSALTEQLAELVRVRARKA
jgi:TPP-dependent pyruvate/acetoin dehydrogenase alpha subunit